MNHSQPAASATSLHVAIIGAGGYVGGELLDYLASHTGVAQLTACSDSRAGQQVAATHPCLQGKLELTFTKTTALTDQADVVFFATPARVAAEQAPQYLDAGATVIDCSPDFRLQDLDSWANWYGGAHPNPQLVAQAVYGLVEHNRAKLVGAKLIAAPGCYATALQLAAVPIAKALAAAGSKQATILAAAVSGTSGAGRQTQRPELLLAEAGNNYSAYALGGHRHGPEVLQAIQQHTGIAAQLRFIPHLLAVPRGMFATVYFTDPAAAELDLTAVLQDSYADEAFASVLAPDTSPQFGQVLGTNRFVLGTAPAQQAVLCAIDNLGKGAAGQAIQAMNVALGLDETAGLRA